MPSVLPTGSGVSAPVAPDTSVGAFLAANPDWKGKEKWLYSSPQWIWEMKDHAAINAAYDSWKMKQENAYAAEKVNFENAYNSYVNQSEMLAAAGYNRNWLGSAPNTPSAQVPFTPSDGPRQTGNPSTTPQDMLGFAAQASSLAIDLYGKLNDAKLKGAQTRSVETQTKMAEAMLPFKMTRSYFDSLPEYLKWYGGQPGDLQYFSADNKHGVTFYNPVPGSYGTTLMDNVLQFQELQKEASVLHNQFQQLSNKEKENVIKAIQPLQAKIMSAQVRVMEAQRKLYGAQTGLIGKQGVLVDNQTRYSDVQRQVAKMQRDILGFQKEIIAQYGLKGAEQRYITGWTNTALSAVRVGVDAYRGIGDLAGSSGTAFIEGSSTLGSNPSMSSGGPSWPYGEMFGLY